MNIDHLAIWTNNLEGLRTFYTQYFDGKTKEKYVNQSKGFESYFIHFGEGASLEIMSRTDVNNTVDGENLGLCHFAFTLESEEHIAQMTELLRKDGYTVASELRLTGDGFYESTVLDPDGNRIELVCLK